MCKKIPRHVTNNSTLKNKKDWKESIKWLWYLFIFARIYNKLSNLCILFKIYKEDKFVYTLKIHTQENYYIKF